MSGGERLVHNVNVGCSEGQVTWRIPHGGLRVAFTPPPADDHDAAYDVCCVVTVTYCDVRLSLDGAGDSLRLIAVLRSSSSSSSESVETCFSSSRYRTMSLYAESLTNPLSRLVGRLVVDYDVRSHVNTSRDTSRE